MNPQPPVTNMRIAAPTSSGAEEAPLVSPTIGNRLDQLLGRAAHMDWTPWAIIALGAFLRLFLLGIKPPHFDEGINGWFVDQMVKNGFYRYDPKIGRASCRERVYLNLHCLAFISKWIPVS